jgi:putative SOS response-associated peptidase YedK
MIKVAELFGLDETPDVELRYNVAPTQQVVAVRLRPDAEKRELVLLRWGLIPHWADDPSIGNRMINARAETVADKPAYRQAFKKRRCLVVADGFYEWKKIDGKKQPYYIRLKDDRPFGFAGLWERWNREGEEIQSCTIITTEPNELMKPIHNRMPVIVPSGDYDRWLDPEFEDGEALRQVLQCYSSDAMEAYPVSTLVNNPRNETAGCIERLE